MCRSDKVRDAVLLRHMKRGENTGLSFNASCGRINTMQEGETTPGRLGGENQNNRAVLAENAASVCSFHDAALIVRLPSPPHLLQADAGPLDQGLKSGDSFVLP